MSQLNLTPKDFESDQDIRWCPGCGDYAILKQMQRVLPELGIARENTVFISGIGCSSRFPYYLNTYGIHSIHGRAPAIASGLKAVRPDLSIWIVTGDGDSLSIGGNHLAHILRRNFDVNILLFNNEIYGLTKGQYSPTSPMQKITKSTPLGSLDKPFNPLAFAMGADGSFIARSIDKNPKHLQQMLKRSHAHSGTSLLEIYQNCNIFNDGAFEPFSSADKMAYSLFLEHDKPLVFGKKSEKGIVLDAYKPKVVSLDDDTYSINDLWVHDEHDVFKSQILMRFFEDPRQEGALPRPFGVLFSADRTTYEQAMDEQLEEAQKRFGEPDFDELIAGKDTWVID